MVVGMEGQGGLKQPRMKQAFDKLLNGRRGAVHPRLQAPSGRKLGGTSWEMWMQGGHGQSILPCPQVGSGPPLALKQRLRNQLGLRNEPWAWVCR